MRSFLRKTLFPVVLILAGSFCAFAQIEQCPYIDNPGRREPLSDHIKERMIELCIEDNKKEFEKLVARSEEAARLSEELEKSFNEQNSLTKEDREKLERVEDLLGKIRKELRADKDEGDDDNKMPETVMEGLKQLQENTGKLLNEIKKTTRHSISAVAVQSSNTVLKLIKFLRFTN